jgi:hypothetical protein
MSSRRRVFTVAAFVLLSGAAITGRSLSSGDTNSQVLGIAVVVFSGLIFYNGVRRRRGEWPTRNARLDRKERFRRFLIWMPIRLAILIAVAVATAAWGLPGKVGLVLVAVGFFVTVLLQYRAPGLTCASVAQ